jgi:DNA-binding LytR/AlgR family response regulator
MGSLRIFIVEDKTVVAEHIASVLENAGYETCGNVSSGEEALELVADAMPDVILMDIHLAGQLDGIETAKRLNAGFSIPIIYLTDHGDTDTFNRAKHTHPANYLSKPFDQNRLLQAIELAFFNASKGSHGGSAKGTDNPETIMLLDDRFFIKDKGVIARINVKDVLWIEADGSYYKIKTEKEEHRSLVGNLTIFSKSFQHPYLLRVHRSYIVNIDKIVKLEGNTIRFEGTSETIPTSNDHREELKKRFHIISSTKE